MFGLFILITTKKIHYTYILFSFISVICCEFQFFMSFFTRIIILLKRVLLCHNLQSVCLYNTFNILVTSWNRRSLLTQSPFQAQQKHYSVDTPESLPSGATMGVVGECSGRTCSLETPHSCLKSPNIFTRNLTDSHLHLIPCEAIPSSSKNVQSNLTNTESCNRILISSRAFNLPAKNLEKEFCSDSALPNKETLSSYQTNGIDTGCASFLDDQFYEGLDLDELEAQATKLLSQKTGSSAQKRRFSELSAKNKTLFSSPLFDLGIWSYIATTSASLVSVKLNISINITWLAVKESKVASSRCWTCDSYLSYRNSILFVFVYSLYSQKR